MQAPGFLRSLACISTARLVYSIPLPGEGHTTSLSPKVIFVGFKFFPIRPMIFMWTGSCEPHKENKKCMIC